MDNQTRPLYDVIAAFRAPSFPTSGSSTAIITTPGCMVPAILCPAPPSYGDRAHSGGDDSPRAGSRNAPFCWASGTARNSVSSAPPNGWRSTPPNSTQNLVAYLNADSSGKGKFNVGGSHSLEAFVQEVSRDISDPVTGKPLMDGSSCLTILRQNPAGGDFRIDALGSGSDYTPFLQHLGIASPGYPFCRRDSGVYHSAYDDFNWYSHFSDTTFAYGRTLSQVHRPRS